MDGQRVQGPFAAVVFAGGGCRCFWQAGFWAEAAAPLGLAPRVVAGVSAGAAFACAIFAGVIDRVIEDFCRRVAANPRNVYPGNALRDAPIFPHGQIYRSTILGALDEAALRRLQAGPEVRVSIARPPAWSGVRSGVALGILAFLAEQPTRGRVHAAWGRRFGFRNDVVTVRQCRTARDLAELILHSSCTPPITPAYRRSGEAVLDGGIYDHVPVDAVASEPNALVLLTRQHPEAWLPRRPGRTYVQPSQPVPIARWDYTSPHLVRETFDLGRRDGERFAREFERSDAA